jgi:hypothetical protein
VQSVYITAKIVNSNSTRGEVYLIQHYVIKFVSNLRKVSGILRVLRFIQDISSEKLFNDTENVYDFHKL